MKKTIIALAAAGAGTFAQAEIEGLAMSATFGFESEYVFRGVKLTQNAFQSSVDVSYMGAYAGIWTSFAGMDGSTGGAPQGFPPGTVSTQGSEVDYYIGYALDLDDTFTLDFGGTAYTYPDFGGDGTLGGSDTFELYFGAAANVVADPAFYIYYDTILEVWTFELSGGYSMEVYENTSLDFGGFLGFQTGDNWLDGQPQVDGERIYWTLTADAVYALAENASIQIGPRIGGFNADHSTIGLNIKPDATYLWWGASFTAGF